jgi:hypothetical protein
MTTGILGEQSKLKDIYAMGQMKQSFSCRGIMMSYTGDMVNKNSKQQQCFLKHIK